MYVFPHFLNSKLEKITNKKFFFNCFTVKTDGRFKSCEAVTYFYQNVYSLFKIRFYRLNEFYNLT